MAGSSVCFMEAAVRHQRPRGNFLYLTSLAFDVVLQSQIFSYINILTSSVDHKPLKSSGLDFIPTDLLVIVTD